MRKLPALEAKVAALPIHQDQLDAKRAIMRLRRVSKDFGALELYIGDMVVYKEW